MEVWRTPAGTIRPWGWVIGGREGLEAAPWSYIEKSLYIALIKIQKAALHGNRQFAVLKKNSFNNCSIASGFADYFPLAAPSRKNVFLLRDPN
jgi:hypothetical protein